MAVLQFVGFYPKPNNHTGKKMLLSHLKEEVFWFYVHKSFIH